MSSVDSPIPVWIKRWLMIAAFIMYMDGSFCCLRPHSFPNGCLSMLYLPYRLYIQIDKHYADVKDSFVLAQGMLNLVEAGLYTAVLLQLFSSIRWTKLMAICSSIMTCWKSLLFLLYSYDLADESRHVENWFYDIALVFMPSLAFTIIPAYAAYILMVDFAVQSEKEKASRANTEDERDARDSHTSRYNLRNR